MQAARRDRARVLMEAGLALAGEGAGCKSGYREVISIDGFRCIRF